MSEIDISVYSNEDLTRGFNLKQRKAQFTHVKSPTSDQLEPRNVTGATFTCSARFGATMLEIEVQVANALTGEILLFKPQADIEKLSGQTGTYDLVMNLNGPKRLWGGSIRVLIGK